MTYSEFGRRIAENSHGGTDHGTLAPHAVMGGGVRGKRLIGIHPDLVAGLASRFGNLPFQKGVSIPYQRLYRSAADWLGLSVAGDPFLEVPPVDATLFG